MILKIFIPDCLVDVLAFVVLTASVSGGSCGDATGIDETHIERWRPGVAKSITLVYELYAARVDVPESHAENVTKYQETYRL
jgi:hypothetical protein